MGSKNSRNSDAFSREDPRATCSPGKFCVVGLSSLPRFLVELLSEISNDVSTRFLRDGSRKTFCPVAKSRERPCIQVFLLDQICVSSNDEIFRTVLAAA